MSKATTHYDVLQVRQDASQEVIEGAYRALSKRYHPDAQRGDEEQMKMINAAYNVLRSSETRIAYDRMLRLTLPPEAPIVRQEAPVAMHIRDTSVNQTFLEEQLRHKTSLLRQYRHTIDGLREEIDKLTQRLDKLLDQNERLQGSVKHLQDQYNSLRNKQARQTTDKQDQNELNDSIWFQLSISPRLAGVIYTLIVLGVVAAIYYAM